MKFHELPRVFPEMAMWGASRGANTFVISKDGDDPYIASVKVVGATPFDGGRYDLGAFDTFGKAQTACENWRPS